MAEETLFSGESKNIEYKVAVPETPRAPLMICFPPGSSFRLAALVAT